MGREYDLELIKNYVEGNDIDCDIEGLENDYKFMISVIKYTNDKHMYDLCSDNVKNNYEFIKFMINYFKDDMVFIDKLAEDYILGHKDVDIYKDETISLKYIDIISDMVNFNKDNIEHYNKWYMYAKLFYFRYMGMIELSIKEEKLEQEFGKGFFVLEHDFEDNIKVLDFFAINIINDELFNKDGFDLEKEIHRKYDGFNEIEEQGINNYMINLIECFDKYLSGYVSGHLNTLNPLKEVLLDIKNNWNEFLDKNEKLRYEVIINSVHNYIVYSEPYCTLGELEALYYVSDDLGIVDKVKELEGISDEDYQELMGYKEFVVSGMSDNERKHYNNIKNMVSDILSEKVVDDSRDSYTIDTGKNKSKILRVDFKNMNYL